MGELMRVTDSLNLGRGHVAEESEFTCRNDQQTK